MRRMFFPLSLAIALAALSISTNSAPWGWLVQKTSGSAEYLSPRAAPLPLEKGLVLRAGTTLRTGGNGKALLVREEASVFIGPYTVAAIAARPTAGMQTTVLLQRGETNLNVRKKSRPHLSVETPYLVAVVKGTRFKVAVAHRSAEVAVEEGRVEVKALSSGYYADVSAGQKAVVDRDGNLKLSGKGKLSPIKKGSRRAPILTQESSFASGKSKTKAGVKVNSKGVSAGGMASIGGASVGAGASVGHTSAGAGVSTSGGLSAGAGVSIGGRGLGVSIGGR
jgi:hypothetical protein